MYKFWVFILLIITGCGLAKERSSVHIHINPEKYGWYFIRLDQQPNLHSADSVLVTVDSAGQEKAVTISAFEKFNYKIFGIDGTPLSYRMKMPAFIYHTTGKLYYRFYNPTEAEYNNEINWNPKGPYMEDLREQSVVALNKMINQK